MVGVLPDIASADSDDFATVHYIKGGDVWEGFCVYRQDYSASITEDAQSLTYFNEKGTLTAAIFLRFASASLSNVCFKLKLMNLIYSSIDNDLALGRGPLMAGIFKFFILTSSHRFYKLVVQLFGSIFDAEIFKFTILNVHFVHYYELNNIR